MQLYFPGIYVDEDTYSTIDIEGDTEKMQMGRDTDMDAYI